MEKSRNKTGRKQSGSKVAPPSEDQGADRAILAIEASSVIEDDFGKWLATQGGRLQPDFEIDL